MNAPTPSVLPGWCSFAHATPSPNVTPGRAGVRAVVLHVTDGSFAGALSWLTNPRSEASAHFVIGLEGQTHQLISLTDTAWANGLQWDAAIGRWRNHRKKIVAPTWPLLTPPTNPNRTTVAIEVAGFPANPWTPAQHAAVSRVLRWIASVTGLIYAAGTTLIGHCHLDTVDRVRCPGPHVDFARVAAAANAAAPEPAVERGAPYQIVTDGRHAIVRAAPTTRSQQLRSLPNGARVLVVRLCRGGAVQGSTAWAELAGGGFVWRGLLQPLAADAAA